MVRWSRLVTLATLSLLGTTSTALVAHAQPAYDTPTVSTLQSAQSFISLDVTAGASGAPAGFTVEWMSKAAYDANGGWPTDYYTPGFAWCTFTGTPTLNMTSGIASYQIGPGQTVRVVLGELFDETGVSTNYLDEMVSASQFVVRIRAEGDLTHLPSANSPNLLVSTATQNNCTFTQGYWKNHPDVWPVSSLTLGTVTYTASELLQILNQPAGGNGLISLAHQLIAAKLNIAQGADPTPVASTIAAADALIGGLVVPPIGAGSLSPASTSAYTTTLDDYNNGLLGVPHCGSTPTRGTTWGHVKALYR